jgi:hypothetical protein
MEELSAQNHSSYVYRETQVTETVQETRVADGHNDSRDKDYYMSIITHLFEALGYDVNTINRMMGQIQRQELNVQINSLEGDNVFSRELAEQLRQLHQQPLLPNGQNGNDNGINPMTSSYHHTTTKVTKEYRATPLTASNGQGEHSRSSNGHTNYLSSSSSEHYIQFQQIDEVLSQWLHAIQGKVRSEVFSVLLGCKQLLTYSLFQSILQCTTDVQTDMCGLLAFARRVCGPEAVKLLETLIRNMAALQTGDNYCSRIESLNIRVEELLRENVDLKRRIFESSDSTKILQDENYTLKSRLEKALATVQNMSFTNPSVTLQNQIDSITRRMHIVYESQNYFDALNRMEERMESLLKDNMRLNSLVDSLKSTSQVPSSSYFREGHTTTSIETVEHYKEKLRQALNGAYNPQTPSDQIDSELRTVSQIVNQLSSSTPQSTVGQTVNMPQQSQHEVTRTLVRIHETVKSFERRDELLKEKESRISSLLQQLDNMRKLVDSLSSQNNQSGYPNQISETERRERINYLDQTSKNIEREIRQISEKQVITNYVPYGNASSPNLPQQQQFIDSSKAQPPSTNFSQSNQSYPQFVPNTETKVKKDVETTEEVTYQRVVGHRPTAPYPQLPRQQQPGQPPFTSGESTPQPLPQQPSSIPTSPGQQLTPSSSYYNATDSQTRFYHSSWTYWRTYFSRTRILQALSTQCGQTRSAKLPIRTKSPRQQTRLHKSRRFRPASGIPTQAKGPNLSRRDTTRQQTQDCRSASAWPPSQQTRCISTSCRHRPA